MSASIAERRSTASASTSGDVDQGVGQREAVERPQAP